MPDKTIRQLDDFTGKTVIVTGAARGIGFGVARRFHQTGANVVIADINDELGRAKTRQLGERTLFVQVDVGDETQVISLISQTLARFGSIDILVNNAGIFPTSFTLEMDLAFWERVHATNLRGTFLCCREAARVMKGKGGGVIINITSLDALRPTQEGVAAYDSSKHGQWGFTMLFAREVAQYGIRVNAIAPGGISTEGVQEMIEQSKDSGIDMEKEIREVT